MLLIRLELAEMGVPPLPTSNRISYIFTKRTTALPHLTI